MNFPHLSLIASFAVLTTIASRSAAVDPPRLKLERIASLPRLSGTTPAVPAWSRDGARLAFVWNDKAFPFRDVWVASAAESGPRRITDMARAFPYPENPDRSPEGGLASKVNDPYRGGAWEVVWTPDGKSLIFTYETAYGRYPRTIPRAPTPSGTDDLFRVNADGTGLMRLTDTPGDRYALSFSPDGRFLSFLQEGDLWLWHQATGHLVRATRMAEPAIGKVEHNVCCGPGYSRPDLELSSYQWSPDSRYVALHLDDRRRIRKVLIPNYLGEETWVNELRRDYPGDNDHLRDIAIYSVAEGRLRVLGLADAGDRSISNYSWSPDGKSLLVDRYSQSAVHRWISVVNPEDGSLREVWHDRRDTRTTQLWNSIWQSDGQGILFVTDMDGRHHIYELSLEGGRVRRLTQGDWSVVGESGPAFLSLSPASKELLFIANKESPYERHLYRMPEKGGEVARVTSLPGVHHPFPAPGGEAVALLHSNDRTPTELYVVSSRGSQERRITHSPPHDFHEYPWVSPRYVTFKSHVDGVTLHGRVMEPANLDRTKKYPVIVGPVYPNSVKNRWADREEWRGLYSTLQQYLTIEGGYIGLLVDVRGSVGYGREFREKLHHDYGGIDIEDIHSGVEYLKTLPYVDPDRIGIWGSSYGGLMTTMSLFKKPGVYKAGVASAPATNLGHAMTAQVNVADRPNTHPEVYRKVSAVSYGENLRDHLMILHGMQDDVVLFKDSVVLAEKLMMLGKDFDFVVVPNALHEWSSKDYAALYVLQKVVGHFDRHLGRGPR